MEIMEDYLFLPASLEDQPKYIETSYNSYRATPPYDTPGFNYETSETIPDTPALTAIPTTSKSKSLKYGKRCNCTIL